MVNFLNNEYNVIGKASLPQEDGFIDKQIGYGSNKFLYTFFEFEVEVNDRVGRAGSVLKGPHSPLPPVAKRPAMVHRIKRLAVPTDMLELARERGIVPVESSFHQESFIEYKLLLEIIEGLDKFSDFGDSFIFLLVEALQKSRSGPIMLANNLEKFPPLGEKQIHRLVDTLLKSGSGTMALQRNLNKFPRLEENHALQLFNVFVKCYRHNEALKFHSSKFLCLGDEFSLKLAVMLLESDRGAEALERNLAEFLCLGEEFSCKFAVQIMKSGHGAKIVVNNIARFPRLEEKLMLQLVDELVKREDYDQALENNLGKFLSLGEDFNSKLASKLLNSDCGSRILARNLGKFLQGMSVEQKTSFVEKLAQTVKGSQFVIKNWGPFEGVSDDIRTSIEALLEKLPVLQITPEGSVYSVETVVFKGYSLPSIFNNKEEVVILTSSEQIEFKNQIVQQVRGRAVFLAPITIGGSEYHVGPEKRESILSEFKMFAIEELPSEVIINGSIVNVKDENVRSNILKKLIVKMSERLVLVKPEKVNEVREWFECVFVNHIIKGSPEEVGDWDCSDRMLSLIIVNILNKEDGEEDLDYFITQFQEMKGNCFTKYTGEINVLYELITNSIVEVKSRPEEAFEGALAETLMSLRRGAFLELYRSSIEKYDFYEDDIGVHVHNLLNWALEGEGFSSHKDSSWLMEKDVFVFGVFEVLGLEIDYNKWFQSRTDSDLRSLKQALKSLLKEQSLGGRRILDGAYDGSTILESFNTLIVDNLKGAHLGDDRAIIFRNSMSSCISREEALQVRVATKALESRLEDRLEASVDLSGIKLFYYEDLTGFCINEIWLKIEELADRTGFQRADLSILLQGVLDTFIEEKPFIPRIINEEGLYRDSFSLSDTMSLLQVMGMFSS